MNKGCLEYLGMAIGAILMALVFMFLFAYFGMLLWNYAVTAVFGLPLISYWQMLGLLMLVRLFFPININYNKK